MCNQLAGTGCIPDVVAQYVLVFKCFIVVLLYRFIYTLSTLIKEILHFSFATQIIGHTVYAAIPEILVTKGYHVYFYTVPGAGLFYQVVVSRNHDIFRIHNQNIDIKHSF